MDQESTLQLVSFYHRQCEELEQMMMMIIIMVCVYLRKHRRQIAAIGSRANRIPHRQEVFAQILNAGDRNCIWATRMDVRAFNKLCELLRFHGRLNDEGHVTVEEQVCMFLMILAKNDSNRCLQIRFIRSGETISRYFNKVLRGILRLQHMLYAKPEPVADNCEDPRWKNFKGCLGALDGTYLDIIVPEEDKPRYRGRKGRICTNVLGVCDRNLNFIYVLAGWEGSASDSRVLRDAVTRRNGLQVPKGNYYLVDAGYTNGPGFLAPYRGTRYHVQEWARDARAPRNKEEFFNKKHSSARNCIERAFGLLKKRWRTVKYGSFYSPKTHVHIILACCLLHNYIRMHMNYDPAEDTPFDEDDLPIGEDATELIDRVEGSEEWTQWRENLAAGMFQEWSRNR